MSRDEACIDMLKKVEEFSGYAASIDACYWVHTSGTIKSDHRLWLVTPERVLYMKEFSDFKYLCFEVKRLLEDETYETLAREINKYLTREDK